MAVETLAGTVVSISAGVPATFDEAGYAALTFTAIGEIVESGAYGTTFNEVTTSPMAQRRVVKFKGVRNEGNLELTLDVSRADAGQVLMAAALESDADYSFSVEYQGGDVDYFRGKVMSFANSGGNNDTMRRATCTIGINTEIVEV